MERKNIKLDENWVTVTVLAEERGIAPQTVSGWIRRNRIDYVRLPGALRRGYLVDRRTAPPIGSVGWQKGRSRKAKKKF